MNCEMYEETEEIVVFLQCLQTKALAHKKPETTPSMLCLTVVS